MTDRLEFWGGELADREFHARQVEGFFREVPADAPTARRLQRLHHESAEQARRVLRAMAGSLAEGGGG